MIAAVIAPFGAGNTLPIFLPELEKKFMQSLLH